MAEKRMISKKITESDAFLSLSFESQALYIHLIQGADDDGVVNAPLKITRMIGASGPALEELVNKAFLIRFESGIVLIKHWLIHNSIKADRYKPTEYQEEMSRVYIKPNGAYTLNFQDGYILYPKWRQNGDKTERRLDKNRLDKKREEKGSLRGKYDDSSNPPLDRDRLEELLKVRS